MKKLCIILVIITLVSFQKIKAQDGEKLFKSSCAACHSIGKGRLLGPDLLGISSKRSEDWLIRFIKSSKSMVGAKDKDAVAIVKEFNNFIMPDSPLSETEIKAVLSYINAISSHTESSSASSDTIVNIVSADIVENVVGDAQIGKKLFEGRIPFSARGPACLACHTVDFPNAEAGGLLAKNLTHSFSTLGSEAAISGILMSPPFPSMQVAYKNTKLSEPEISHIAAYLKMTSEQKYAKGRPLFSMTFVFGLLITIVLFDIFSLVWRKRKKRSVNESIINRQIR